MRLMTSILLIAVMFTAYGQVPSAYAVRADIGALRKEIIPAKGTSKAEVEAVYGVGREVKELKGKGSPTHYPMHTYELLPPKPGQNFRAFLYVAFCDEKVHYVGINHICVAKNRVLYARGSAGEKEQKEAIASEDVIVLTDLREIRQRYADALAKASWNRQNPKPHAADARTSLR